MVGGVRRQRQSHRSLPFPRQGHRRPVVSNRDGARRNRVEASALQNIAFVDENGREAIQIMGYGMSEELGDDGAFFTLEGNLFEEAHGEAMEIVSIKSNRNVIRSEARGHALRPEDAGPAWMRVSPDR